MNLNYTVFDEEKFRTLRRKVFEFIVLKSFKHVNVKIIITYFALTSFYIVIENILRGIGFMKKLEAQAEGANYNIESEGAESQFNHNNNQKKSKNGNKQKMFADKNSQTSAQSSTDDKFKKKSKQFKSNHSHLTCHSCEQKKHIVFDSKCPKFATWQKSRNRDKKSKKEKA